MAHRKSNSRPGSQPGSVVTLPDKGIPKLGNPVARGDQRITVTVDLPSRLSDAERGLLEQLAGHHSARGKQHHHHNSGLFARLFGQKDERLFPGSAGNPLSGELHSLQACSLGADATR